MRARPAMPMTHLIWPVRLTMWGMVAEQTVRAFWPLWTVIALVLAPVLMGWHELVPLEVLWGASVVAALAGVAALGWGLWKFRWPLRAEAVARVDESLPGQPISAVADAQAIGAGDPASQAVWRAHLNRMAERTRQARAVEPDLRISNRDPYGLRFIALLFVVCAGLFGSLWRAGTVTEVVTGETAVIATGPVWEGWIEPPDYTGKPSLYLADIPEGAVDVSEGSRITLRLYGEVGDLTVNETVSGRTEVGAASDGQQQFDVLQNGRLEIMGGEDVAWQINVLPDDAPSVEITGEVDVDAEGVMTLPFRAVDDYAIARGEAEFALDLERVVREHGLAIDPDAREPLIVDLPLPFSGDRSDFEEILSDDFSQHPYANLAVTVTLTVEDALLQSGQSEAVEIILPGRRFFQPVARAVIEQRQSLLWSTANAPEVLGLMRAISHRPEDIFTGETVYLRFREIQRNLEAALQSDAGLTDEVRDELAAEMWELALQLEEGSLADARERLARAQERLEEAMRNGATEEEIAELMQELREATDDYLQLLADETDFAEQNQTDQPDQGEGQQISGDQIQELMDEIQRLMEEGQMAEAMELMEQLNELLENLQITQGEGGEGGPQTPGQESMEDLQDNLREQQELSDEAFRELQEQFNGGDPQDGQQQGEQQGQDGQQDGQDGQGGQQGEQQGQGMSPGEEGQGDGQQRDFGQGGEGGDQFPPGAQGSLAERQEALRQELERLRDNLPALSGEEAEAARRAIDRAEGAMEQAEEALREEDLAEAINRQAEAMEAMREGLRALGRALAENEQDREPGQSDTDGGTQQGEVQEEQTDPLGRELGSTGQYGTEEGLLQGPDVYRRAEELLEELRRRSADQERPEAERDYLRRLLDRF